MSQKRVLYKNKYLILDGYNVINASLKLKEIAKINLEEARNILNEKVINYASYTGEMVYLVYDAYLVKNTNRNVSSHGNKMVNIIFTKEHQTADSYIEGLVERLLENRNNFVRVVTRDWAQQQAVLGSGAIRQTPNEFFRELEISRKDIDREIKKDENRRNALEEILDIETFEKLEMWRKG